MVVSKAVIRLPKLVSAEARADASEETALERFVISAERSLSRVLMSLSAAETREAKALAAETVPSIRTPNADSAAVARVTSFCRPVEAVEARLVMAPLRLESAAWKAETTSVSESSDPAVVLLNTLSMRVPRACSAAVAREISPARLVERVPSAACARVTSEARFVVNVASPACLAAVSVARLLAAVAAAAETAEARSETSVARFVVKVESAAERSAASAATAASA